MIGLIPISVPLAEVMRRLEAGLQSEHAGSPGLVDFQEASPCADRLSSPGESTSETTA